MDIKFSKFNLTQYPKHQSSLGKEELMITLITQYQGVSYSLEIQSPNFIL